MPHVDLELARKALDREITYFHFKKAHRIIRRCLAYSRSVQNTFFEYYFYAQAHILDEDFTKAIAFLDKALLLRPDDGCCYNDKALCLADAGHLEKALASFDEGVRRDPSCVSLYHNKGWLLNCMGNYRQAIICFHKVLEFDAERPETLYCLADTYAKMDRNHEALTLFRKVCSVVKGICGAMYRQAQERIDVLEGGRKTKRKKARGFNR